MNFVDPRDRLTPILATNAAPKPGESRSQASATVRLPWCRLTKNLASTIDRDPPDHRTFDVWYDEESGVEVTLLPDGSGAVASAPHDPARTVKIEVLSENKPMPDHAWHQVLAVRKRMADGDGRHRNAHYQEHKQRVGALYFDAVVSHRDRMK